MCAWPAQNGRVPIVHRMSRVATREVPTHATMSPSICIASRHPERLFDHVLVRQKARMPQSGNRNHKLLVEYEEEEEEEPTNKRARGGQNERSLPNV